MSTVYHFGSSLPSSLMRSFSEAKWCWGKRRTEVKLSSKKFKSIDI